LQLQGHLMHFHQVCAFLVFLSSVSLSQCCFG
jgi:hypothetical protein